MFGSDNEEVIFPFHQPEARSAFKTYTYCYLVFEQKQLEDFGKYRLLRRQEFPIHQLIEEYDLSLIVTNYFVVEDATGQQKIIIISASAIFICCISTISLCCILIKYLLIKKDEKDLENESE